MTPHYFRCHIATLLCSASFLCLSSAPGCYHEQVYFCACWLPVKKWSVPHVPEYFLLAFSTGSTLYALSSTNVASNHQQMFAVRRYTVGKVFRCVLLSFHALNVIQACFLAA